MMNEITTRRAVVVLTIGTGTADCENSDTENENYVTLFFELDFCSL